MIRLNRVIQQWHPFFWAQGDLGWTVTYWKCVSLCTTHYFTVKYYTISAKCFYWNVLQVQSAGADDLIIK